MRQLLAHPAHHAPTAWALVAAAAVVAAATVFWLDVQIRTQQRQVLLHTEAQRSGVALMSTTLNGNLMGSVALLGLIDLDIKQEAVGAPPNAPSAVLARMAVVGQAFGAEGVFVVDQDGTVQSSWDRINKPSTGLDVRFRPYFQMAMRGQTGVYAAVSMARGDRSLYFAAPVFPGQARGGAGVGAVVARTTLQQVDRLLQDRYDLALLLSPQGVVFAGNRNDWTGRLAGEATPQRLEAIRALKQFGAMFEHQAPLALPLAPQPGVQTVAQRTYAVSTAPVRWNDPSGDWQLIVAEDLGRTVPVAASAWRALAAGALVLLLGAMWLRLLRVRQAQRQAQAQLQVYANEQEQQARYRTQLGALSVRLQHCKDWAGFSSAFFPSARELAGVMQGTLYVAQGEGAEHGLVLAGSAACADAPPPTLALGEGLLGQCALERTVSVIQALPERGWDLRSGLGGAPLSALVLAPLVMQDTLIGVVELGLLEAPDARQRQRLDDLVYLLANHLEIHRAAWRL